MVTENLPPRTLADCAVEWRDGRLWLLDQRALPARTDFLDYADCDAVAAAITDMVVRGAPAIGVTAAYAVVLAARQAFRQAGAQWRDAIGPSLERLRAARPTAVNLGWAVTRMQGCFAAIDGDPQPALLAQAKAIHDEDYAANLALGELGAGVLGRRGRIITHCNAGALATGGYGTALGVVRSGFKAGHIESVYADETRPWLQGARLTAWEMVAEGIPVELIADGAAAHIMRTENVSWVIVGSDRIAANGDVANKIGTLQLAIAARYHGVRVMVAAPSSTIDWRAATGDAIPIEERATQEVLACGGTAMAASGAGARNPAFDITPAELVDVIVTERGVVAAPSSSRMGALRET